MYYRTFKSSYILSGSGNAHGSMSRSSYLRYVMRDGQWRRFRGSAVTGRRGGPAPSAFMICSCAGDGSAGGRQRLSIVTLAHEMVKPLLSVVEHEFRHNAIPGLAAMTHPSMEGVTALLPQCCDLQLMGEAWMDLNLPTSSLSGKTESTRHHRQSAF
jgi:hypothetical protein